MADNIVGGLFGVDPAALQQQQQQQQQTAMSSRAFNYANLAPQEQAQYGAYMAGGLGGQAIQGLFGAEDPQIKKAKMAQQLASQFDITSAEGLKQYADALAKNGAPDLAQLAANRAMQMEAKGLDIQKSKADVALQERKVSQDEKLREELMKLGDNPTEEQYLKVFRQFGTPDQQAKAIEARLARRERLAAQGAGKQLTPAQQEARQADAQIAVDTVKEALDLTSEWSTGYGSVLSVLPKTDARKLQGKLDTIKSNLAAAMIEDMKSQSKTGATGLGALNREELKVLQTSKASLDAGMGADELKKSLAIINKYFSKRAGIATATPPAEDNTAKGSTGKPGFSRDNPIKLD